MASANILSGITKGTHNTVAVPNYPGNLAGYTITYRVKADIEDATTPLTSGSVSVVSSSSVSSQLSFDLDLTINPTLLGLYWLDLKFIPLTGNPFYSTPQQIEITPTLQV